MSAALIALCVVTFALGIAAGNGPRLLTTARDAAQAWQPRRIPAPFTTHLMEGTTIMSADNIPANRPDGWDDTPDAEVVDLDTWTRAARPGHFPAVDGPRPVEAVPADEPDTTPAAPDDDGPVVESRR